MENCITDYGKPAVNLTSMLAMETMLSIIHFSP